MTEKEMIEEMAKCYCDYCMAQTGEKECEKQADKSCSVFWDCEFFYNAGHRKIPEGAVALTREENEKWLDFLELNMKKARKETARGYYKAMKETIEKRTAWAGEFTVEGMLEENNNLAKQFGVEVE